MVLLFSAFLHIFQSHFDWHLECAAPKRSSKKIQQWYGHLKTIADSLIFWILWKFKQRWGSVITMTNINNFLFSQFPVKWNLILHSLQHPKNVNPLKKNQFEDDAKRCLLFCQEKGKQFIFAFLFYNILKSLMLVLSLKWVFEYTFYVIKTQDWLWSVSTKYPQIGVLHWVSAKRWASLWGLISTAS